MRYLTKLAVAVVLVSVVVGMRFPVRGFQREITLGRDNAVITNDGIRFRLIQQANAQRDQDLKLLLALKVFVGNRPVANGSGGSGSASNVQRAPEARGPGGRSGGRANPSS